MLGRGLWQLGRGAPSHQDVQEGVRSLLHVAPKATNLCCDANRREEGERGSGGRRNRYGDTIRGEEERDAPSGRALRGLRVRPALLIRPGIGEGRLVDRAPNACRKALLCGVPLLRFASWLSKAQEGCVYG